MIGKSFALMATCFLLVGCADHFIWQKVGATQSEFEQVKAACMLEGHNQIPEDNERRLVSGSSSYSSGGCQGKGCSGIRSYTPPQYQNFDKNEDLRKQVIRACLFRNGWEEVKVEE